MGTPRCHDHSNLQPHTHGPAVRETLYRIYREYTGATQPEAETWLQQLRSNGHYSADVWIG